MRTRRSPFERAEAFSEDKDETYKCQRCGGTWNVSQGVACPCGYGEQPIDGDDDEDD